MQGDTQVPADDAVSDTVAQDDAADVITACKPGQTWCEGQTVVQCNEAGDHVSAVATCEAPATCYQGGCCTPYCDDLECGDDQCGGLCGSCSSSRHCEDGLCQDGTCEPSCEGRECGPDGCEGLCGECGVGDLCIGFLCMPPDSCVGACDSLECGMISECNCGSCAEGKLCVAHLCKDAAEPCAAECADRECGQVAECDCGGCGIGLTCDAGECVPAQDPCTAACAGLVCGQVGECLCGTCEDGQVCVENQCQADPCVETCGETPCGTVGECDCGTCEGGFTCEQNKCVPVTGPCVGFCAGKECGEVNGCQCGECAATDYCTEENLCQCKPVCDGKLCGPDGCGGECGQCTGATICTAAGLCFDPDCNVYEWDFSTNTARLNTLRFGEDGYPGNGMNVDENSGTCAPNNKCSQGIDNEMGGSISGIPAIGDPSDWIQQSLDNGKIHVLFELTGDASSASLAFYSGVPADEGCNYTAGECSYTVGAGSFDGYSCQPAMRLLGTRTQTSFNVGGLAQSVTVPFPVTSGVVLPLTLYRAHAKGTITYENEQFSITQGILAGAVLKTELVAILNAIPDGVLPVSKDTILNALDWIIAPDQDIDGNGQNDAYSVGFQMTAVPAPIVGVQ